MVEPVYLPVIGLARSLFLLQGYHFDLTGTQHVPRAGGAVLASNHVSHFDFIFAGYGAHPSGRYVRFMAKESIFRHRVAGPLMRGMKHISVDRTAGAGSFTTALDYLRRGEMVGIFPEATISRAFQLKEFKNGAARLAQEAGVPLVPVALWGTQRLATYDRRANPRQRGIAISIYVGPAVDTTGTADEVTVALKAAIGDRLDAARAAYVDDGAGQWWQPADLGGTAPTLEQARAEEMALAREHIAKQRAARKKAEPDA